MNKRGAVTKAAIHIGSLFLLLGPSLAFAHGQQIVFVPVGQVIAVLPATVIAWRLTRGWLLRTGVVLCAVLVPTAILFMPIDYIPWWLVADEISSFLTGFLSSVLLAIALSILSRAFMPRTHGT